MGLIDILDLNKAFRRIEQDKRDDAWPDIVGYRDIKRQLNEFLGTVQPKIREPLRYIANAPSMIDLPKRGFTLRPGVVPQIEDRLVYQAIADLLAPHFTPESCVYSNRFAGKNSDQMFVQGVELWVEFQNKVEEYCHIFPFVVETDITAYFDHINHDLLFSRIKDVFQNVIGRNELSEARNLLSRLLRKWNSGFERFGIPQINDASSFFANLYLDELDKWLLSRNMVCLRYVDDIRIFTKDEPGARKALADLIVKMREMGLYVASGKTKIKSSMEVLKELEVGRKQIELVETEIDSHEQTRLENAGSMLMDLFMNIVSDQTNFNDRLFRFCVNRFKKLYVSGIAHENQNVVIGQILGRLSSMPESTDVFIDYLSLFPNNRDLQACILDFLEGKYNIYPWQEMQLIELLIRLNISPDLRLRVTQFSNTVISDGRHPAGKSKAYVLLGKNGTYAERRDIRSRYTQEDRFDVRRSIITAIQEMRTDERNHFYQSAVNDSVGINMTIDYIKSLPNPLYHYYNPPHALDVIPPDYDSDDLSDLGSEYFI